MQNSSINAANHNDNAQAQNTNKTQRKPPTNRVGKRWPCRRRNSSQRNNACLAQTCQNSLVKRVHGLIKIHHVCRVACAVCIVETFRRRMDIETSVEQPTHMRNQCLVQTQLAEQTRHPPGVRQWGTGPTANTPLEHKRRHRRASTVAAQKSQCIWTCRGRRSEARELQPCWQRTFPKTCGNALRTKQPGPNDMLSITNAENAIGINIAHVNGNRTPCKRHRTEHVAHGMAALLLDNASCSQTGAVEH